MAGVKHSFPQVIQKGMWKSWWKISEYCRIVLTSGVVCFTIDKEYWVSVRLSHCRWFGRAFDKETLPRILLVPLVFEKISSSRILTGCLRRFQGGMHAHNRCFGEILHFLLILPKKIKKSASFCEENLYLWYKVIFPKGRLKAAQKI